MMTMQISKHRKAGSRALVAGLLVFVPVTLLAQNNSVDQELRELIGQHKLDAPFEPDHPPSKNKLLVDLGADLFFSPDLSIDGKVACSSCHSIDKGGADGTALTAGLGGKKAKSVGEQRIAEARETYGDELLHGLIPRNSPTVFNAALYRKNLFWDGRAEYTVLDSGERIIKAGFDLAAISPTAYENRTLLQTQARMPLTSLFEMKGSLFSEMNNVEIEQEIVRFLRTSPVWCGKFNRAYQREDCEKSITLNHLTNAIAEYESTLVFVDSPFQKYIEGNRSALSEEAKKGALLFLKTAEDGGLGCVNCHYGKIFSSENFFNIGVYSSGVGANQDGYDFGRRNVDRNVGKFRFKNPSLLNISETAPYFHNGMAATLEEAIRYHVQDGNADKIRNTIRVPKINHDSVNAIIESEFRQSANADTRFLLPKAISEQQLASVIAFLQSLTDPCIKDSACLAKFKREEIASERNAVAVPDLVHSAGVSRIVDRSAVKKPVMACANKTVSVKPGQGKWLFTAHDSDVGIDHLREVGLVKRGWLLDIVNHGGVSASDVNGDCLDDLVFDAGEKGLVFYLQKTGGTFERSSLDIPVEEGAITPLIMDLDGDYLPDLFVGNSGKGRAFVVFDFLNQNQGMFFNTLRGPVINATIADIDNDGDMDMAMAFWRSYKSMLQDNIWMNDGNGNMLPKKNGLNLRESDTHASDVSGKYIVREPEIPFRLGDASFTPNFADIDGDGNQDLLLAADFVRSQVLRNDSGNFIDITRKEVIDESNGMGAAVGDFDNDGLLDWYITSINLKNRLAGGNSLYRNTGKGAFVRLNNGAAVNEDAWSWGSCTADFNNDGHLDLFYVSGYGEELKTARYETMDQKESNQEYLQVQSRFRNSHPKLLLNNGKGGFVDRSLAIGFDQPFDGRGLTCFDFEQDGDIDVLVAAVEGKPRLYKNNLDSKANWIALRLVGQPGNSEAIGAKVTLQTKLGEQYREVRFENNYLSRNPAQLHFGLGKSRKVDRVVIDFPPPSGKQVVLEGPAINKLHIISQPD
jgi:cytochrome c peroxidase